MSHVTTLWSTCSEDTFLLEYQIISGEVVSVRRRGKHWRLFKALPFPGKVLSSSAVCGRSWAFCFTSLFLTRQKRPSWENSCGSLLTRSVGLSPGWENRTDIFSQQLVWLLLILIGLTERLEPTQKQLLNFLGSRLSLSRGWIIVPHCRALASELSLFAGWCYRRERSSCSQTTNARWKNGF